MNSVSLMSLLVGICVHFSNGKTYFEKIMNFFIYNQFSDYQELLVAIHRIGSKVMRLLRELTLMKD